MNDGYFTNHSLRASAATRLFDSGVEEQLNMSRTGQGVRVYKKTTTKLKEITSDILNGKGYYKYRANLNR